MSKKDILFYTFLIIFILTAVITMLGIIDVVKVREDYLNTLVAVFVVELAGAVIAIFRQVDFFSEIESARESHNAKGVLVPSGRDRAKKELEREAQQSKKISDISAEQYFSKLKELDGRFAEEEEFEASLNDSLVEWFGFVNSVSMRNDEVMIQLKCKDEMSANVMHLFLPEQARTRALSLRKGDKISFNGVIKVGPTQICPSISGKTFEIMS